MHIEKAIFINRAPFEHIELDFKGKGVNVLTAINGKGKTTILSHIVDAFYEMARNFYTGSFMGHERTYYRISSDLYNLDKDKPSVVYLRFRYDDKTIDYVDVRRNLGKNEYDEYIDIQGKIPFEDFSQRLQKENNIKTFPKKLSEDIVRDIFNNNVVTYFPSYRFEQPAYLTEQYNVHQEYNTKMFFLDILPNPIEVTSHFLEIMNWIMDLVLDKEVNKVKIKRKNNIINKMSIKAPQDENVFKNVTNLLIETLSGKIDTNGLRFGIGRRNSGGTRLSVVREVGENISQVIPSVTTLSSGEMSLFSMFAEVLKQGDKLNVNTTLSDIHGIVLIDEVDKHLHIKLQKEVLPKFFKLFPNVQFIVSSHSPFLNMGLGETMPESTCIFDLDNGGIVSTPTSNEQYEEVYNMMIEENNRFAQLYENLKKEVEKSEKALIITEGKTDIKHLKAAQRNLAIELDVDFIDMEELSRKEGGWGSPKLLTLLQQICKVPNKRMIIGIFDRDEKKFLNELGAKEKPFKEFGNNVYGFAIPAVNTEDYGTEISIEHYYKRENLTKYDKNGRRIFLKDEFFCPAGNSKDGKYQTNCDVIKNPKESSHIIDVKVYKSEDLEHRNSLALCKNDFAELILNDPDYAKDFDFSNFNKIFDVIKEIIDKNRECVDLKGK